MGKKVFDYTTPALCGAFSLFLKGTVWTGNTPTDYVGPTLGAIALYVVLTFVVEAPRRFRWARKALALKEEAILEGYWIENEIVKNGVSYYSIFDIRFDYKKDKYRVSGTAHSSTGALYADWDSVMVNFEPESTELSYVYIAHLTGQKPIPGYAALKFITTQPVEIGHGFIVDCDNPPLRMEMQLDRVSPKLIKQLIGKKTMDVREREEFIRKYHAYRQGLQAQTGVADKRKAAGEL